MEKGLIAWLRRRVYEDQDRASRRGYLDRNFEWKKFLAGQVFERRTFRRRDWTGYLGYTGTAALVLIAFQMMLGLLLLVHYVPDPDHAFASYLAIRNEVPFGAIVNNLHSINASLIVLLLFVHMFRIMLISAHRGPREVQWHTGVILLFLMLLFGFSGYLLPWSQQSYWAGVIGTESARAMPLIGDFLVRLLRGGDNMSGETLRRFFALHVAILPSAVILLTWLHVKRVWRTGVIAPAGAVATVNLEACAACGRCQRKCAFSAAAVLNIEQGKGCVIDPDMCNSCRACEKVCRTGAISFADREGPVPTEPLLPHNFIDRVKAAVLALGALFFAAFFLPGLIMRVKAPADPMVTPESIKPEWYFLASYQVLRELPSERWGLLSLLLVALIVFFLPAYDKKGPREPRRRPVYIAILLLFIAAFVALTIQGMF